jgi:glycolate oxidase FAD binding subunit
MVDHPRLRPADEADLAAMIRTARGPLAIRGGGTRGAPEGPAIETGGLSGIVLYEPGALTLVVRAGTPLAEVERVLAAEGQRLAFEPPDTRALLGRAGVSTIGGVVAANASGPRRVQAGACRDFLLGVRFVDGTGTVVKNGGRVMKNVTGYDLVRLMAGSRGALGVITEVALKVLPAPEATATVVLDGLDTAAAVAAMARALATPWEVTGAAHLPEGAVVLRVEGFADQVRYRAGRLAAMLGGRIEDGPGPWAAVRDATALADWPGDVWRVHARATEAPALVARARAGRVLADWGGALLWLGVEAGADLRARLGPFAGHATRVRGRGPGPDRPPEAPAVAALSAAIRAKFDPRGVFAG